MCNHCDLHRTRAAYQRTLAATAEPAMRQAHLELALVHDRRLMEYQAIHDQSGRRLPPHSTAPDIRAR